MFCKELSWQNREGSREVEKTLLEEFGADTWIPDSKDLVNEYEYIDFCTVEGKILYTASWKLNINEIEVCQTVDWEEGKS